LSQSIVESFVFNSIKFKYLAEPLSGNSTSSMMCVYSAYALFSLLRFMCCFFFSTNSSLSFSIYNLFSGVMSFWTSASF
jgi:hypothetical protein